MSGVRETSSATRVLDGAHGALLWSVGIPHPYRKLQRSILPSSDGRRSDFRRSSRALQALRSSTHHPGTVTTVDDEARRATIERLLRFDNGSHHDLYHDDAILEFPQSAERFEGLGNFREWRDQYPSEVTVRVRRIVGSGDVWVGELSASYDGGPWMLGISVHEFRGERIARERIYVTEPWTAPEWRAPWRAATPAE
jgi:hypothetical protein